MESIIDFTKKNTQEVQDRQKLFFLMDQYMKYKREYVDNIKFDPSLPNLSMSIII